MEWHLICKMCGQVVDNFRSMSRLHSHYTCTFCSFENDVFLDDYIQVAFTLSPHIRDLIYHHPDRLSPRDFFFKYRLSKGILPWSDSESFYELMERLTPLAAYVEPGTTRTVEYEAAPGILFGADMINKTRLMIFFDEAAAPGTQHLKVQLIDGRLSGVNPVLVPQRVDLGGVVFNAENAARLQSGSVRIDVENHMPARGAIWLFHAPNSVLALKKFNEYEPFLSGKRLLCTRTFRDLFRTEVVQSEEGIGVRDITFMFTDLKGSTALYDQIGDAKAYYLVRQHFDTLGRVIGQNQGAIVKTIGDAVMATFMTSLDAVKAALAILNDIEQFNQGISEKLVLKIGLHHGHSIVVTLNDRLDYFGQTVNIASRIQNLAGAGEIYLSEDMYDAPGVNEYLAERSGELDEQETILKGIGEKMKVYRLAM
jgi:class 3 adenylate cyclase